MKLDESRSKIEMVRLVKMAQFFNGPKIKTDCDIELKFDTWTILRDIKLCSKN